MTPDPAIEIRNNSKEGGGKGGNIEGKIWEHNSWGRDKIKSQMFIMPDTKISHFKLVFYSACHRRGGVLNSPRFCLFFGVASWPSAHG